MAWPGPPPAAPATQHILPVAANSRTSLLTVSSAGYQRVGVTVAGPDGLLFRSIGTELKGK